MRKRRRGGAPRLGRSRAGVPSVAATVESVGSDLSDTFDPAQVAATVTERLARRPGVAACAIWERREDSLELVAASGKRALPPQLRTIAGENTILVRAVRRATPQLQSSTLRQGDPVTDWAREQGLKFLACYPLTVDGGVRGVLLVGGLKSANKAWLSQQLFYAEMAALALRDSRLLASARQRLTKLNFLVEASQALNSTLDLPELLARILEVAKSQVEAERGTLFLVDEPAGEIWSLIAHGMERQEIRLPLGKGIAGHVARSGETVNIPEAYADPRFNPDVDKRTGYTTRNILCLPIRNKSGKIIAVLQLLNKRGGAFTQEDADFLLTLSTPIAIALENAQLHQAVIEKERLEKEMALARGIQRSLLPETTPNVEGFDLAVLNEPCYAVGGDYYDFLTLGPHTLLAVIADVEGKGVASALVMSNLQAALRALILHLHSLNDIVEALNRKMLTDTRSRKYLSLFMALLDLKRKSLHYINCGHVPPVIVRPGKGALRLTVGGTVIGLFENAQFERGQEKLQPGDILALCTDGITEAMDAEDEEYGMERLAAAVERVADQKASDIVAAVCDDVTEFSRRGTHLDDKVMIAIKAL